MLAVVNAGGDADTNAAVACSLLGARYGLSSISQKYTNGLLGKDSLGEIAEKVISILNKE